MKDSKTEYQKEEEINLSHYEILGLDESSSTITEDEIRKAYIRESVSLFYI